MDVRFIASVSVIVTDPNAAHRLFLDTLGLALSGPEDDEYLFTEALPGAKHFGVWPLDQAAQACFGLTQWPNSHPTPQASVEFDVDDVEAAAAELERRRYQLLHTARTEPWGRPSPGCRPRRG